MAQLTCENVSLGYDNKTILSNLSFSVNSGDYLCIVGENGSGKSTLMRTMLGLQKPMSGEISLGDGLKKGEIGSKELPGFRKRNRFIRMSGKSGTQTIL